jgi:hypothetical protein
VSWEECYDKCQDAFPTFPAEPTENSKLTESHPEVPLVTNLEALRSFVVRKFIARSDEKRDNDAVKVNKKIKEIAKWVVEDEADLYMRGHHERQQSGAFPVQSWDSSILRKTGYKPGFDFEIDNDDPLKIVAIPCAVASKGSPSVYTTLCHTQSEPAPGAHRLGGSFPKNVLVGFQLDGSRVESAGAIESAVKDAVNLLHKERAKQETKIETRLKALGTHADQLTDEAIQTLLSEVGHLLDLDFFAATLPKTMMDSYGDYKAHVEQKLEEFLETIRCETNSSNHEARNIVEQWTGALSSGVQATLTSTRARLRALAPQLDDELGEEKTRDAVMSPEQRQTLLKKREKALKQEKDNYTALRRKGDDYTAAVKTEAKTYGMNTPRTVNDLLGLLRIVNSMETTGGNPSSPLSSGRSLTKKESGSAISSQRNIIVPFKANTEAAALATTDSSASSSSIPHGSGCSTKPGVTASFTVLGDVQIPTPGPDELDNPKDREDLGQPESPVQKCLADDGKCWTLPPEDPNDSERLHALWETWVATEPDSGKPLTTADLKDAIIKLLERGEEALNDRAERAVEALAERMKTWRSVPVQSDSGGPPTSADFKEAMRLVELAKTAREKRSETATTEWLL